MPVTKIVPRFQVLNGLRLAKFHRTPYGRMKSRLAARNQPREAKVMGGRIGGRNQPREAKVMGGRIGGRRYNELYGNPGTPEGCAKGGRKGGRKTAHLRWHRNRNYFKNDCSYCWKEL